MEDARASIPTSSEPPDIAPTVPNSQEAGAAGKIARTRSTESTVHRAPMRCPALECIHPDASRAPARRYLVLGLRPGRTTSLWEQSPHALETCRSSDHREASAPPASPVSYTQRASRGPLRYLSYLSSPSCRRNLQRYILARLACSYRLAPSRASMRRLPWTKTASSALPKAGASADLKPITLLELLNIRRELQPEQALEPSRLAQKPQPLRLEMPVL